MKTLIGKDYIANERLTNRQGDVLAEPGDRCDRVSPESLTFCRPGSKTPWLLEGGHIRLADKEER